MPLALFSFPYNPINWGVFDALSLIVRVTVFCPVAAGEKVRPIEHFAPAARVLPQVVAAGAMWKMPVALTFAILTGLFCCLRSGGCRYRVQRVLLGSRQGLCGNSRFWGLCRPGYAATYDWSGWPDLNRRPHAPQAKMMTISGYRSMSLNYCSSPCAPGVFCTWAETPERYRMI